MKNLYRLLLLLLFIPSAVGEGMPSVFPKIEGHQFDYNLVCMMLQMRFSTEHILARVARDESKCEHILVMRFNQSNKELELEAVLYDSSGKKILWQDTFSDPSPVGVNPVLSRMVRHIRDEYFGEIALPPDPIV